MWLVQLDPQPKRPARFNGLNDGWLRLWVQYLSRFTTFVDQRVSMSDCQCHGLTDSWTGNAVSGPGWCATDRDGG